MKLNLGILFTSTAAVSARLMDGIPLSSSQKIMSDATMIRELQNNNGNFEYPTDWLLKYSLQYQGCYSVRQIGGAGAQGEEGQSNVRLQHLVKYRVCPLGSCGRNCKGEYLIEANQYIESYMEYQREAQELACETARENCYCNDDVDDEACEKSCFVSAGLDYCIESDDDSSAAEEFEAQEFMECRAMDDQNNNNNNYNSNMYYVGMKCVKNNLYLDVFEDASCSVSAASGTYEKNNYGNSLPYSKQPLISSSCVSCDPNYAEAYDYQGNNQDDNSNNYYDDDASTSATSSSANANNNNENDNENDNENNENNQENNQDRALAQDDASYSYNNNYEISEMCERTYEESVKCEKGLNIQYPRNQDCGFFKEIKAHAVNGKSGGAPPFLLFLFMLSTAGLGYMVYDLKKNSSQKINLSAQEGVIA